MSISDNIDHNSMDVVIGLCRHDSSWDRYLIRVKYVTRLLACVTITATSSSGHVTLEDELNPPDEAAVMVMQASNLATYLTLTRYLSHEQYWPCYTSITLVFPVWIHAYLPRLPWIFPGAPLTYNGASGNIQGNLDRWQVCPCPQPLLPAYLLLVVGTSIVSVVASSRKESSSSGSSFTRTAWRALFLGWVTS